MAPGSDAPPSRPNASDATPDTPRIDAVFAALVEPHFDSAFYLSSYPDVAQRVAAGEFRTALHHYLAVGHRDGRAPNADFDEPFYLRTNRDVVEAVERGALHCGFHHYLLWGRAEGRMGAPPMAIVCVVDAVEGNEIRGWAANLSDPSEVLELVVVLSGIPVGRVRAEQARPDLLTVLPTSTHGFSFRVPHVHCDGTAWSLAFRESRGRNVEMRQGPSGRRSTEFSFKFRYDDGISIALRADQTLSILSEQIEALREDLALVRHLTSFSLSDYRYYYERFLRLSPNEIASLRQKASELTYQPTFSIVLPVFDTDLGQLDRAIRSALDQTYPNLELCIADDASTDDAVRDVIRRHAARDPRVHAVFADENLGLAGNTNRALSLATGDYVAFLDHDDLLTPDALHCMALSLQNKRFALLYSDEDLVDEADTPLVPHLKPDLDYDFLLALNYVCHFLVVDRRLAATLGFREGFDGCQDRDFVLRALEVIAEDDVCHVRRVLYHWRLNTKSVSQTAENRASILERTARCVQEHLERTGQPATARVDRPELFSCRVTWALPTPAPKVSIIVPTKDRLDLLGPCLSSLLRTTRYPDFEVVIVNHESTDKGTLSYLDLIGRDPRVCVVDYSGAFNWAALNNFATTKAHGTVFVFLNNDTIVVDPDWLSELVGHAMRADVGAVGARLLYEDGTVQHAGVVLGVSGFAGHAFQRAKPGDPGYLGRALSTGRVSAVTGACLACRRDVFEAVTGFDSAEFPIGLNDVDFCLRVSERGYKILYVPHAVLYHLESKSRGYDSEHQDTRARLAREAERLRARWGAKMPRDPWYNPAFDLDAPPYERLRARDRQFSAEDATFVGRRENLRPLPRPDAASSEKDRRRA